MYKIISKKIALNHQKLLGVKLLDVNIIKSFHNSDGYTDNNRMEVISSKVGAGKDPDISGE